MSGSVCVDPSSAPLPGRGLQEYDTPSTQEYDTPSSDFCMKPSHCVPTDKSGDGKEIEEPVYAAPDEMNVINNMAYATGVSFSLKSGGNVYSTPDAVVHQENAEAVAREELNRGKGRAHRRGLCSILCALLLFLSLGLSIAALVVVLVSANNRPACECSMHSTAPGLVLSSALGSFQDRLNQTDKELQQSRRETERLASRVNQTTEELTSRLAELAENTNSLLAFQEQTEESATSTNISQVLHSCTTSVETRCTADTQTGECQTPCVLETQPGSVAVNFQCIRLESEEPNPLIGVLDVRGGEVLCLCYVLERSPPQTHDVDCALRVTRCSLANTHA